LEAETLKKIITALDNMYNRCIDYLFYISEALVIILMLIIVADVTIRYTLRGSIPWGFEFSEYTMVYLTFLGTAWLLRNNGHVKMDILNNILKPIPNAYLNFIACIILVITCAMLLWYGTASTIDSMQSNLMSVKYYSIPKFIFIIIIPISSFLLIIQAIKHTAKAFNSIKSSAN
jgi:C4-dicarboxylate transporter DctQ subunit